MYIAKVECQMFSSTTQQEASQHLVTSTLNSLNLLEARIMSPGAAAQASEIRKHNTNARWHVWRTTCGMGMYPFGHWDLWCMHGDKRRWSVLLSWHIKVTGNCVMHINHKLWMTLAEWKMCTFGSIRYRTSGYLPYFLGPSPDFLRHFNVLHYSKVTSVQSTHFSIILKAPCMYGNEVVKYKFWGL